MFRHAFIDRLKGCGDVPVPVAEAITGHGRNASEFARYGSVSYTLEQKKAVIERILVWVVGLAPCGGAKRLLSLVEFRRTHYHELLL
jgi:hypothetical protein